MPFFKVRAGLYQRYSASFLKCLVEDGCYTKKVIKLLKCKCEFMCFVACLLQLYDLHAKFFYKHLVLVNMWVPSLVFYFCIILFMLMN